jgi:hypothetical protein
MQGIAGSIQVALLGITEWNLATETMMLVKVVLFLFEPGLARSFLFRFRVVLTIGSTRNSGSSGSMVSGNTGI